MKSPNVSELKSHLSSYLAAVQRGEEILVRDRNRPIARIIPLTSPGNDEAEEAALVAAGVMTLPRADKLPASFFSIKGASLSEAGVVRVIRNERDED